MAIWLENKSQAILFHSDSHEGSIYHINKDAGLGEIVGNNKCSNWILQLHRKTWLDDVKILYQVAKIIEVERPENEINWEHTFFLVEKGDYFQYVKELKDIPSGSWESIMLGHKESTADTDKDIRKIVKQNLTDYGIIEK